MDVNEYTVLNGMFKPLDGEKYEYRHEDALFDGSMYDLSDHQPIYSEVTIGDGDKYVSHREDPSTFYVNPNTENDKIITSLNNDLPILKSKLEFKSLRLAAFTGCGYLEPTAMNLVEDKEKGTVLRFVSGRCANSFKGIIEYRGIFNRYSPEMNAEEKAKIENAKKLVVTFKTELSIERVDLKFFIVSGDPNGDGKYKMIPLPTDKNGEWRTIEIDISDISGIITKMGIYGGSQSTGLLKGDAVYIESIDFE